MKSYSHIIYISLFDSFSSPRDWNMGSLCFWFSFSRHMDMFFTVLLCSPCPCRTKLFSSSWVCGRMASSSVEHTVSSEKVSEPFIQNRSHVDGHVECKKKQKKKPILGRTLNVSKLLTVYPYFLCVFTSASRF